MLSTWTLPAGDAIIRSVQYGGTKRSFTYDWVRPVAFAAPRIALEIFVALSNPVIARSPKAEIVDCILPPFCSLHGNLLQDEPISSKDSHIPGTIGSDFAVLQFGVQKWQRASVSGRPLNLKMVGGTGFEPVPPFGVKDQIWGGLDLS